MTTIPLVAKAYLDGVCGECQHWLMTDAYQGLCRSETCPDRNAPKGFLEGLGCHHFEEGTTNE
ncbi:MAG: hypothetical protein ACQ9IQ_10225 [Nitrospirales bacterium]